MSAESRRTRWYLVHRASGTVVQTASSQKETFQVHPELFWHRGPALPHDAADLIFDEERRTVAVKELEQPSHQQLRASAYPDIAQQLDMLWHDMKEGRIAGRDSSSWFQAVDQVKRSFPAR